MGKTVPQSATGHRPDKRPIRDVPDPDGVVKDKPLTWGYRFLDLAGEWSWRKLDGAHAEELHRELVAVEGKTLFSLLREERVKDIPVEHMKPKAKERLNSTGFEEAEVLYEIRLPHKWHVWGLVEGSVFLLLWWTSSRPRATEYPRARSAASHIRFYKEGT